MDSDRSWFTARLRHHLDSRFVVTDSQAEALFTHFQFLLRWNARLNLTSIRSPDEIVVRHYCESLFFALHLQNGPVGLSVGDVGSGAGFPGIAIAVLRPDWQVRLLESHQRKAVFLRESARHLKNVSVISERAETLAESFQLVVSRAVDPAFTLDLVDPGSSVGLLIGTADWRNLRERPDFRWSKPVPVPWGERRIAVFGERVSRETVM